MKNDRVIGVVGLGYVGLPLAIEFGKKFSTIGFDLKHDAIVSYKNGIDPSGEVANEDFVAAHNLEFTEKPDMLSSADYIIVAVPTPIDSAKQPDLRPVISASETVGSFMKKGSVVIFESTVYPGVTEEICVPILEKASGLQWKQDFYVGYSPERINPGDKERTLTKIVKVVSGDTKQTLENVSELYGEIIDAGIYPTSSIKEAEAAKVIENTQRDLNIALINELAIIFDRMGIDTLNVLKAAGSKWNFLPFRPGLVGGHCIGVDPYYLTHKAESMGYNPQVILAGRRINDSMGKYIVEKTVKMLLNSNIDIRTSKVGVLGLTFKEDCPDLRNSRVVDIIEELKLFGISVLVHDPKVSSDDAKKFTGIPLCKWEDLVDLGALIIAVPHKEYCEKSVDEITGTLKKGGCLIDVKSMLDYDEVEDKEVNFWRL